jgi:hypothetical protein
MARHLSIGLLCTVAGSVMAQAGPPAAESSPYSLGAGLNIEHDDNLFRAPAGQAQADQRRTGQLFGELDQRYGRQRLLAHQTLRDERYQTRHDLDNVGYTAGLGWEGSTEADLSWTLSHEASRRLAAYGTVLDPGFRGSNIETLENTQAGVQLGLLAQWAAHLALSHRRAEYTAVAFELQRVRLNTVGASLQWNPLGPLSASIGPRLTRGHVPTASDGLQRDFQRRDLDFGLHWVATGQSELRSRLSLTRQRYDGPGLGDFDGATGQVDWQWTVTGKTRLHATLARETGSETAFFTPPESGQVRRGSGDDSQLTTAISTHVDHELTGKITLGLDLQAARRQLTARQRLGDGSVVQTAGSDRSALVRLGVRYTPTRTTALACELAHERRGSGTPLSSSYRANTAGCKAQITLRWY